MQRWDGSPQVWALLALAVVWAALDLQLSRTDGRWYGLLTLAAALQQLFDGAAGTRGADDAAFLGPWALALWGGIGDDARVRRQALARGRWPRGYPAHPGGTLGRGGCDGALWRHGRAAPVLRAPEASTLRPRPWPRASR